MLRPSVVSVLLATAVGLAPSIAAQDVWAKVPPFPTSCYDNETPGFVDRLSNIRHEIVVASDQQNDINSALRQKVIDMDPSEKQSKMMAFMMKNPTEAGKVMQDMATAGQREAAAVERLSQKTSALSAQLKAAEAKYATDFKPLEAVQKEYQKEADPAGNPARARQLAAQFDAGWEQHCTKYLKAESSPLLKYLADYKTFLLEDQIPGDEAKVKYQKFDFDINGIASTTFKSTAVQKAVTDYLTQVTTVFGRLRAQPITSR